MECEHRNRARTYALRMVFPKAHSNIAEYKIPTPINYTSAKSYNTATKPLLYSNIHQKFVETPPRYGLCIVLPSVSTTPFGASSPNSAALFSLPSNLLSEPSSDTGLITPAPCNSALLTLRTDPLPPSSETGLLTSSPRKSGWLSFIPGAGTPEGGQLCIVDVSETGLVGDEREG
jgi:hypothetical protein